MAQEFVPFSMHSLKNLAFRVGFILSFGLIIGVTDYVWKSTSRYINFVELRVKVEKIDQLCKLVDTVTLDKGKRTMSRPCPQPVTPYFDKKRYPTIKIESGTFVAFQYRSPADGNAYVGQVLRQRNDAGKHFAVGDEILVYASRYYPDEVVN